MPRLDGKPPASERMRLSRHYVTEADAELALRVAADLIDRTNPQNEAKACACGTCREGREENRGSSMSNNRFTDSSGFEPTPDCLPDVSHLAMSSVDAYLNVKPGEVGPRWRDDTPQFEEET